LVYLKKFFRFESLGGILLFASAIIAIILENSSLVQFYNSFRDLPVAVQLGNFSLSKPLYLWVNDGLMAIFFLLVGMELKREVLNGRLSSKEQIILPLCAALGGIIMPSLIFYYINIDNPENLKGWAIPAATDIAFALGVLSLFGRRVPIALKVFLTALAIFDDLAAILIIAFFYTSQLSLTAFCFTALFISLLYLLNRFGVKNIAVYCVLGALLWVSVLKSGVHATLAGVVLALAIPFKGEEKGTSPLKNFEHSLHPWVAFGVLPLFAFLNSGVSFKGLTIDTLFEPLTLGIIGGLCIGKQVGVFGGAWLIVKLGYSKLPNDVTWLGIYAASLLAGIGFTMSLFVGSLAFSSSEQINMVRFGVVVASMLSGLISIVVLFIRYRNKN
ncbi:UNVERIFIED_CONTAM: hypothetical protein GTU68_065435, partial [Idotea baltica]|nr:hypothetical protein [Idotea baltica]